MVGDPSIFSRITQRRRTRLLVDARFRAPLVATIQQLESMGYSVKSNSAWRSRATQEELIRRWEEGDPGIITEPAPPGESSHQFGMADDLELSPPDYDVLGQVAEEHGLSQPDPDDDPVHIELPNWRELAPRWSERRLVPL